MSPTMLPTARRSRVCRAGMCSSCFLAFFAAVFVVNGAMIYSALSTYSGVVATEPYRKGLHYNERIAADERQAHLRLDTTRSTSSRDGHVALTLADHRRPSRSAGLKIEAVLGRPSTNRHDIKLTLGEADAGRYEAQTAPLAEGTGSSQSKRAPRLAATSPIYRARRRLWLKP